jgi:ribosomal protein S18 acetylase RimI-like enzyme
VTAPAAETAPDALVELFEADRAVHVYGLADLEDPYWSSSTWFRRGQAAVGVLDLGSGAPVLYAVSSRAPEATLDLLEELVPVLPDHFVITGVRGLADRLAPRYRADWSIPHVKMHLAGTARLPPADPGLEPLDRTHLDEVLALRATTPDGGAFFVPGLLDTGQYLGLREDGGDLVAVAGVHVLSPRHGVAAVGNVLTHPGHRRRGHARALMGTLCRRLVEVVPTVGLNVAVDNTGARALYEQLGFEVVADYDEAELVRADH